MKTLYSHSIKSHFEAVSTYIDPKSNFIEYCENNMFFITLKPKEMLHTQVILNKYNLFHRGVVKKILGSNYSRKQMYGPFTYAFIDYAGSRQKSFVDTRVRKEHPHVHSLMLSHPNHTNKLDEILLNEAYMKSQPTLKFCSSTDFQKFDSEKGSIDDLITYCTKGINKSKNTSGFDEWRIYSGNIFQ